MLDHPNIGSRVYQILYRQIVGRRLKPGARLKEEHLTKELGISRTPLRDAITRLVKDGYLDAEPRRGARVKKFSAKDVNEIYDIRKALERLAIRLAIGHIAPPALKQLNGQFRGQKARNIQKADRELHNLIIMNCGNKRLIEMLGNLYKLICIFRREGYQSPRRSENASDQHLRIIAALLKGNAVLAEKKMCEHIEDTKQEIIADLESRR